MNVIIEIIYGLEEPSCIIQTSSITEEIANITEFVRNVDLSVARFVSGYDCESEKTMILKPTEIFSVCVEDKKTYLYLKHKKLNSKKRLCELEDELGNSFIRISKSVIVNVNAIDNIEASFGGAFLLTLKNGQEEYISRKYLPELKKCLGL